MELKRQLTALILCGGKGERLRPITETVPKPLVLLNGKPILGYLLDYLKYYGVVDVVIAVGYKAHMIEEFFAGNYQEMNVAIVDSGDVDIIERIKNCSSRIAGDFLLLYGDAIADVDLGKLQEFHLAHEAAATITLWPLKSSVGLFELDQAGNAINYREKPTLEHWVNIGYFYYEWEALSWMQRFDTYIGFLESIAAERKLKGFVHEGNHLTVNTLPELEDAELAIDKFWPGFHA
jgi:glucose-1-phosphate cytidylyltransferase